MKKWKIITFVILVVLSILLMTSCTKKKECENAKDNANKARIELQDAYFNMVQNPSGYNIAKYNEKVVKDSVAWSMVDKRCK